MTNKKFYQPLTTPLKYIFDFLAIGLVPCFALSLAYGYVGPQSNMFMLYILLSVSLGCILAIIFRVLSKWTKLRSYSVRKWNTLFLCLIVYYLQWCFYLNFSLEYFIISKNLDIGIYQFFYDLPLNYFFIKKLLYHGTWYIDHEELPHLTIQQFPLLFFWILEFLLIVFLPLYSITRQRIAPYSENMDKWYPKYKLLWQFKTFYPYESFFTQDSVVHHIKRFQPGTHLIYSNISVFYLPKENKQYLMIENIMDAHSGRGNEATIALHPIEISTKEAEQLLKQYSYRKSRFYAY